MKKIFLCLACLMFSVSAVFADEIDKLIKEFKLKSNSDISIYVKDIDSNKVVYKKYENKLLNPASTLKVLSYATSLFVLGENYEFETALYEDGNDLYIKLSADAKFTYKDLEKLLSKVKNKQYENIYIDRSIFNDEQYPDTWLEEDKFPYARAITPYIIDDNLVKISIKRSSLATNIDIIQEDDYKVAIINNLKNSQDNKQNIKIEQLHGVNTPILTISGEISKDEIINLPVLNLEINFIVKMQKAMDKNNIVCPKKIVSKTVPTCAKKVASVQRKLSDFSSYVLLNSDNFITEVITRAAAAKYFGYEKSVGFDDVIEMLNNILEVSSFKIKIADASGVSRQNLITTEFYINAVEKLYTKTAIKNFLMEANQGTMKDRALFLQGNLKAKTGTLRNYSSIFANLITKNNNDIILISIEQHSTLRKALLKNFEDMLLGIIYKKY